MITTMTNKNDTIHYLFHQLLLNNHHHLLLHSLGVDFRCTGHKYVSHFDVLKQYMKRL